MKFNKKALKTCIAIIALLIVLISVISQGIFPLNFINFMFEVGDLVGYASISLLLVLSVFVYLVCDTFT